LRENGSLMWCEHDEGLREVVVLSPTWLSKRMAALSFFEPVVEDGEMPWETVDKVWSQWREDERASILKLLSRFDIVVPYPLARHEGDTESVVIPSMSSSSPKRESLVLGTLRSLAGPPFPQPLTHSLTFTLLTPHSHCLTLSPTRFCLLSLSLRPLVLQVVVSRVSVLCCFFRCCVLSIVCWWVPTPVTIMRLRGSYTPLSPTHKQGGLRRVRDQHSEGVKPVQSSTP